MIRNSIQFSAPLFASLLGLACLLPISANAADIAPEKASGQTGAAVGVGSVDLAPHNLPGAIGDYELRARVIGISPGGAIPNHPHAGRPGIVRVTKGTVIEYRGETKRTLEIGDTWYENADTVHWFQNPHSSEAAEIWVVDLVPKKK